MNYKNGKTAQLYDWVMFKNPENKNQIIAGEIQRITDRVCEVAMTTFADGDTRWEISIGECWPISIAWALLVGGMEKPTQTIGTAHTFIDCVGVEGCKLSTQKIES
jgi:hypothetical protein